MAKKSAEPSLIQGRLPKEESIKKYQDKPKTAPKTCVIFDNNVPSASRFAQHRDRTGRRKSRHFVTLVSEKTMYKLTEG